MSRLHLDKMQHRKVLMDIPFYLSSETSEEEFQQIFPRKLVMGFDIGWNCCQGSYFQWIVGGDGNAELQGQASKMIR